MRRTIGKYGKYTLRFEQGRIDRRELMIVLAISAILALILTAKYLGVDVLPVWWGWK